MKYLTAFRVVCALALTCSVVTAQTVKTLNPLTSFGPSSNGRIEPPSSDPLLDSSNNQRGMAVDPISGNLVLLDPHSGSGGGSAIISNIFVLDGNTGLTITNLNITGIAGGAYTASGAGVADDGAVYVCNQVTASGTAPLVIYRWDSVTSTNPPSIAFSGTITPSQRYGASMDVRGAGANTQIILGSMPNSSSGTNVVIFTTTDGSTFTANVLACPDVTTANFQEGIAFGEGNTFWAKKIGAPLRLMSFDLGTLTATTIKSFDAAALPMSGNLGPIAVDNVNHLLAAIDVVSGTTGPERVYLYSIADTNRAPILLDYKDYNPNFANSSAPPGFLDFNGSRLYSHVVNNGMAAFSVDNTSTSFPTILLQPPASTRLVAGQGFNISTYGYPNTTYQWQKNGTTIPNATNATLSISSVQVSDAGTYRALVSNSAGTAITSDSVLVIVNPADLYHLNTLFVAAPAAGNYVTSTGGSGTPSERNLAYNTLSNQLYVVQKSGANYTIHVIDGNTGQKLYALNTNGIQNTLSEVSGSNPLNLCGIACAEDGAIYACNETPNASGGVNAEPAKMFRIYRWANSDSNTVPVQIFQGDPANQSSNFRWGDILTVRGTGTNTQLLLDNQNNSGHYYAIIVPTDETMTTWVNKAYIEDDAWAFGTGIGRSIDFGSGNVAFQKRKGAALLETAFDPDSSFSIPALTATYTSFTNQLSGIWQNTSRKLAVGVFIQSVTTLPDSLDLYDVTELGSPLKIASYNFPQNHIANQNNIAWAVWTSNRVYALEGNNGLLAFELVSGPPGPPVFLSHPKNQRAIVGGTASLSVTLDSTAAIRWQKNGVTISGATNATYTINNASTNDSASYLCIATNAYGAATSQVATVTVELPANHYSLTSAWNAAPDTQPYVTSTGGSTTPTERSFAYNTLSNQLIVVQCPPSTAVNPTPTFSVQVVDATSGTKLYDLRTDNIGPIGLSEVSGSNPLNLGSVAVADDGAIYACNVTPNASGGAASDATKMFRIYRWENSDSNTVPTSIFVGDPAGQTSNYRWGDALTVRGSGTNTEIIVDSNDGNYAAILKPIDATMTTFVSYYFGNSSGGGSIGRSLQYETNNTIWQKRKGNPIMFSSYNTNTATSTLVTNYTAFPTTLGAVAVDSSRQLVIGVDYVGNTTNAPDAVALYDVSDYAAPLLIGRYNFPQNPQKANANFIGKVIVAGSKVFALDGNNGIATFNLVSPANSAAPTLNFSRSGSNLNFSWSDSSAILQSASNLSGPWTDITTAGQTSASDPISGAAKFYRLRK